MSLKNGLSESFNKLSPKGKKYVVWSICGIFLLLFVGYAYHARNNKKSKTDTTTIEIRQSEGARLDPDLMDKTISAEQRRIMEDMRKEQVQLKNELVTLKQQLGLQNSQAAKPDLSSPKKRTEAEPLKPRVPKVAAADGVTDPDKKEQCKAGEAGCPDALPDIPTADQIMRGAGPGPMIPANSPLGRDIARQNKSNRRVQQSNGQPPNSQNELRGGIHVLTNENVKAADSSETSRKVYLPPSFMEAMLLTGFDASTSNDGKGDPEPLLMRIQTPAWLPNDIKANLAGCFVIGEAVGRLDKERADVRTTTLACLSKSGDAVIDEAIKGFVTDSDAKVGISGHVVSKMGSALARTFAAGFMGGAGEAIRDSATTTSTTALGQTSIIDSSQVGKAGLGTGLANTADKLSDFYLNLAKQSTPVIEVQAEKRLTVVVSEGKWLEIKPLKHEEQANQKNGRKRG